MIATLEQGRADGLLVGDRDRDHVRRGGILFVFIVFSGSIHCDNGNTLCVSVLYVLIYMFRKVRNG